MRFCFCFGGVTTLSIVRHLSHFFSHHLVPLHGHGHGQPLCLLLIGPLRSLQHAIPATRRTGISVVTFNWSFIEPPLNPSLCCSTFFSFVGPRFSILCGGRSVQAFLEDKNTRVYIYQGVMKVDGLKFLNTTQSLTFWKNDDVQETPVISKDVALQDAEDVDQVIAGDQQPGCPVPPFVPYTATVPWHSGTRNLFSRFFPRYGNYCGPNYSSGRESGSLHWDKEPTDWLDYCCYQHDMGYDTYDQKKLHDADKQFLNCLQKIPESARISSVGGTYRNLYMLGLERFLIPYREILVKKIEEGKRGRETAPEVIVEEVRERNVDMNRNS